MLLVWLTTEPAEEAAAMLRLTMCRIWHPTLRAIAAGDMSAFLRLWWSSDPFFKFPMATALVEPRKNVREHQLHIFVRLTGGETMPHPRVELEGLVGAS